jgi:hypothetical protein
MTFQSAGGTLASAISLDWTSGFLTLDELQAISGRERRRRDVASMEDNTAGIGAGVRSVEAFDDFGTAGIEIVRQSTTESQPSAISLDWNIDEVGQVTGKISGGKSFTVPEGAIIDLSAKIDVAGGSSLMDDILFHLVRIEEDVETTVLDRSSASLQRLVRVTGDSIQFTAWDIQPGAYRLGVAYGGADVAPGGVDVDLTFANTHHSAGAIAQALGNVVADDLLGSDATLLAVSRDGKTYEVPGVGGMELKGDHGVLTIQADGRYAYAPDRSLTAIGMTDTFAYQLRHPNGEVAKAMLTINIGEAPFHGGIEVDAVPIAAQVHAPSLERLLDDHGGKVELGVADSKGRPVQSERQEESVVDPLAHLETSQDELVPVPSDV